MSKMKLKMLKVINNDISNKTFIDKFMNENELTDLNQNNFL